jgi:tetratricopeptide (TPR) repeat protein
MKITLAAAVLLLAIGVAPAQRHKIAVNTGTPEGSLLQNIGQESDDAKRLPLLEMFIRQYPKHEGAVYVYEQLVDAYAKLNQPDKVIASGEKLLELDPADVVGAHACLKAALEAKRDPDLVLKWAVLTSDSARKIAQTPKPSTEGDVEDWKTQVDFAKQVDIYTEYALYAMALQTPDPAKKILLGEALETRNPESQYITQVAEPLFLAYARTGENAKAMALAERTVAKDQTNAEMLLAVADSCRTKKQADKVAEFTNKAIRIAASKPKPDGVSDADWTTWRTQIDGRANYVMGITYAALENWPQTDKSLRAALTGVGNSPDMKAETLFYLGLANYRLAEAGSTDRARDALHFSEQCAAIPGRMQGPALNNVKAIRTKYRVR